MNTLKQTTNLSSEIDTSWTSLYEVEETKGTPMTIFFECLKRLEGSFNSCSNLKSKSHTISN